MDDMLREIAAIDQDILSLKNIIQDYTLTVRGKERERENLAAKVANEMTEAGCASSDVDGIRWSVRNTPQKVIITDETLLPPKFIKEKVSKSPDKVLLKNALKNGAVVQGAYLDNGGVTIVAKAAPTKKEKI